MYRHIFRPARPVWLCTHYLLGRPLSIISFTRRLFPITFHTTITENRENPAHCLAASLATTNRRDGSQPDLYLASNVVIGSVPMREWQPNLYSCIRNREYLTDKRIVGVMSRAVITVWMQQLIFHKIFMLCIPVLVILNFIAGSKQPLAKRPRGKMKNCPTANSSILRYCLRFLPRCMECRRGLAMRILSVLLSVCLSNACFVAKWKKDRSRFLPRCM